MVVLWIGPYINASGLHAAPFFSLPVGGGCLGYLGCGIGGYSRCGGSGSSGVGGFSVVVVAVVVLLIVVVVLAQVLLEVEVDSGFRCGRVKYMS